MRIVIIPKIPKNAALQGARPRRRRLWVVCNRFFHHEVAAAAAAATHAARSQPHLLERNTRSCSNSEDRRCCRR